MAVISAAGKKTAVKKQKSFITVINKIRFNATTWLIMLPALFCLYMFLWRPVAMGIGLSAFKLQGYRPVEFVGLKNYVTVVKDTLFAKTMANTFMYVVWSVVIGYLPPVVLAIMLNEIIHGQGFFKTALYMPTIVPGIAVSMIWTYIYSPDASGLLNQIIAVFGAAPQSWLQNPGHTIVLIIFSATWKGLGSTVLMYLAALQGVDQHLYEAAKIDGAGALKRVFSITLPQIVPMMMLMLIQQVIGVFQIFVEPLTMTGGGPNNSSLSLSLTSYNYAFVFGKVANSLAVSVITFIILMIMTSFYLWMQKKLEVD